MALPFQLPSDEETEQNYRRLERLLRELYHVLHALLTGGASFLQPRGNGPRNPPPPPPPPPSGPAVTVGRDQFGARRASLFPTSFTPVAAVPRVPAMPPLLVKTLSGTPAVSAKSAPLLNPRSPASWTSLGHELRLIADSFQAASGVSAAPDTSFEMDPAAVQQQAT